MIKTSERKIEFLAKSIFYEDCDSVDRLMKLAGINFEIDEEQAEALVDFLTNSENLKNLGLHNDIYIVGGAVRDALLGIRPKDIDLVVDSMSLDKRPPAGAKRERENGERIPWSLHFGRAIAREWGTAKSSVVEDGKMVVHVGPLSQDYLWNPVTHEEDMEHGVNLFGSKVEIVSARVETYDSKKKGDPQVGPGTIEDDLKRRDFGINAMALSLTNASGGLSKDKIIDKIIDATGAGPEELKKRLRQVYRPGKGPMSPRKACLLKTPLDPYRTFEDDPSRILRAVRFALKYGCEIEEETRKAMSDSAHFLKDYSWNNINIILIEKILTQPYAKKALHMMKSMGILDVLAEMFRDIKGMKSDFNTRLQSNNIPKDHPILLDLVSMGIEDLKVPAASHGITQKHRRRMKSILEEDPESDIVYRVAKLSLRLDQISKETGINYPELRNMARELILLNPENSNEEVLDIMKKNLLTSEASEYNTIKTASMGPENVHAVADKMNISWDNDNNFMQFSKEITGKDHLDDMDSTELRKIIDALKSGQYCYFEISNEINSLGLSGDVYAFDFDDTLMWAPDWHSDVEVNQSNIVTSPGSSYSVKAALEFANNFSDKVKDDFNGKTPSSLELRKVTTDMPHLGKHNQIIFELITGDGLSVTIEEIKSMFSSRVLSSANIDVRAKYYPLPAVTVDNVFYEDANTLGALGVNDELFDLYKKNAGRSIILTARSNVPGMKNSILGKIKDSGAKAPLAVFTKPVRGPGGGSYKGLTLAMIASIPEVKNVIFFDDNKKYIDDIRSIVQTMPADDARKININMVSTLNKPASISHALVKKSGKKNKKRKAIYSAVFLTEGGERDLLNWWTSGMKKQLLERRFHHHMTIKFRPGHDEVTSLDLGANVTLKVVGYANDENGQAIAVEGFASSNDIPHITISTSLETSPVYSNELLNRDFVPLEGGPEIKGVVGFWNGKEEQYTLENTIYESEDIL